MKSIQKLDNIIEKYTNEPFYVEHKKDGYYLQFPEPRYFYDDGEFLGTTYQIAKINLESILEIVNLKIL